MPLFADVENKNVQVPEWLDHPYGPDQVKVSIDSSNTSILTNIYQMHYVICCYVVQLCSRLFVANCASVQRFYMMFL